MLDLPDGIFHLRKMKLEPGSEQPPGHDTATLEDQLGLGPMDKRRDFEHPTRRGQSERHVTLST
jgi:hypothetical protein